MSISAMKQALDLLETSWGEGHEDTLKYWNETIDVLRQAIKQEKKRKWVGLTEEELGKTVLANLDQTLWTLARDIEAKLKEKNS